MTLKRRKRRWLLGSLALALVGSLVGGFFYVAGEVRVFPGCEFDERTWREEHRKGRTPIYERLRPEIVDLIGCNDLAFGKTRREIRGMLGRPIYTSNRTWHYGVGVPEGLSDYPSLTVQFDDEGRASTIEVDGYLSPWQILDIPPR